MPKNYPRLNDKSLEQFVNRYEEEFGSKILFPQLVRNIFSSQKRSEIILETVIKERIYTSEIDNFTPEQIQELENYLTQKIKRIKRQKIKWLFRNLIYVTVIGIIFGVLTNISRLNLLWILPLFLIFIIDVFKKSQNWGQKVTDCTMLIYWIAAYKLRKNNQ